MTTRALLVALLLASPSFAAPPTTTRPATEASTNAADLYRAAFALLPEKNGADASAIMDELNREAFDGRVGPRAAAAVQRYAPAIALFRRAAAARRCDWGPPIANGRFADLERTESAGRLCDLVQVNVRMLAQGRRYAEAFDDLDRLLVMGRQMYAGGILGSRMSADSWVRYVEFLAGEMLPDAPAEVRRAFFKKWTVDSQYEPYVDAMRREVPSRDSLWDASPSRQPGGLPDDLAMMLPPEQSRQINALWLDRAKRKAALDAMDALAIESARVSELPDAEFPAAEKALQAKVDSGPLAPLGPLFVPPPGFLRRHALDAAVHRALLTAALTLSLDGQEAFARVRDPVDGQPFQYVPAADGYELRSRLNIGGFSASLRVGHADTDSASKAK